MRRLGFLLAFTFASVSAHAQVTMPVYVRVSGTGAIRVRVTERCITPNLFEGQMVAGQTMTLASPSSCVCVEHTYGGFRDVQWSQGRLYCARGSRYGPRESFVRVDLSTDSP